AAFSLQSSHAGELTIEEIIEKVERNEQLYADIDVKLWQIYRDDSHATDADDPSVKHIDHSRESVRFISQQGKFHIESQTSSDSKRDNWKRSTTRLFDGTMTRVLEVSAQDQPGTFMEISGRKDDPRVVRAHMLLLRMMNYGFPLSTYLR